MKAGTEKTQLLNKNKAKAIKSMRKTFKLRTLARATHLTK